MMLIKNGYVIDPKIRFRGAIMTSLRRETSLKKLQRRLRRPKRAAG